MKEVNAKKILVEALLASVNMSERITNPENESDIYFTYVTANGLITGKEMDYEILDIDVEKEFFESLVETIKDKKTVNLFSIADAYAQEYARHFKDEDTVIKNRKNYKILEDVTIISNNGNSPIKSNSFVLFLDQVIGIIPGKAS